MSRIVEESAQRISPVDDIMEGDRLIAVIVVVAVVTVVGTLVATVNGCWNVGCHCDGTS